MGKMKEELMDKVADNMALISNRMDGDASTFIACETECLMADLDKIMQKFAVLKATLDEAEEEYGEVYEEICNDDVYGEDFEEWWETLEKIEDIMD